MNESITQLWEEHAAANDKADIFVAANLGNYPPQYTMQFNWAVANIKPLVSDPLQSPEWNEKQLYAQLIKIFVVNAKKTAERIKRSDAKKAKSISDVVKRMETEEPSSELLGLYAVYSTTVQSQLDAIDNAQDTSKELDYKTKIDLEALGEKYKKVLYSGKAMLYSVDNDEWHEWHDCKKHYGWWKVDVIDPQSGKTTRKNIFDAFNEWKHAPAFNRVVFNPRRDGHYDGNFNLWQGLSVQPEEGDDDLLVWELLHKICDGNEDYFNYVQKWLAHMIQKPWELPGTALGISGKQGLGKNAFIETIGMLLSSASSVDKMQNSPEEIIGKVLGTGAYGYFTSYDQVFGNFNAIAGNKILLFLDEATWGGYHAQKSNTKTAITGATIQINEKMLRALTVPNYRRFIFASNEDFYYGADADDRRLLPLEFKESLRPSQDWFEAFYTLRSKGKMLANLAHRLKNVDIKDWNPMSALRSIEITTGAAIQAESAPDYQHWMDEVAEGGYITIPGDKDVPEIKIAVCETNVEEDDLRKAFQLYTGQKEVKGWNKSDFKKARDLIFGTKKQSRSAGISTYFRAVPSQKVLQSRLDAQYKWKRDRFVEHELLEDKKTDSKILQFLKTA